MRIVHLALFHPPRDTRIFDKECRTLADAGHEVHVVAPAAPAESEHGVIFHSLSPAEPPGRIASRLWQTLRRGWRAFGMARSLAADVYHLHEVQLVPLGIAIKLTGGRVVYDVHEYAFREKITNCRTLGAPRLGYLFGTLAALFEVAAKLMFDGFVAATPTIGATFPSRRTVIVQNFPRRESAEPRDSSHEVPYAERRNEILFVGNLFEARGAVEMVEAMALLPEQLDVRLIVAGRLVPDDLAARLERSPGWPRVELLGWVEGTALRDVWARGRASLVLFHPTPEHLDAYPNKLFESMAAALPVVASDFPLWRQIVEESGAGLLVDPLSPEAIAEAIAQLLEDSKAAEQAGCAGRLAVERTYNWDDQSAALLGLYSRFERKPTKRQ